MSRYFGVMLMALVIFWLFLQINLWNHVRHMLPHFLN